MCNFFSFCADDYRNYKYLDWEYRKDNLKENCDSHTYILTHFNTPPKVQDKWNFFEFNPLTKKFENDNKYRKPDISEEIITSAELWVRSLDFKTIIPQLIIKPIINPFSLPKVEVIDSDIVQLKKWASVWDSVRNSVGDSVRNSMWDSVGNSVWVSVRNSMWVSVWNSVWSSVWAYIYLHFLPSNMDMNLIVFYLYGKKD